MWRTGMCSFGFGNWIFIFASVLLFTLIQAAEDSKLDEGVRFTVEPRDAVVAAGGGALLACGATARGTVRLSWRHSTTGSPTREHAISPQDKYRKVLLNGSLLIDNMSVAVSGQYQCVASVDSVGTIVSREASVLLAEVPPLTPVARSVLGVSGGAVLLPCGISHPPRVTWRLAAERRLHAARGQPTPPPQLLLNVTWLKNGSPVVLEAARVVLLPSGALEIDPAHARDAANYACRVSLQHHPEQYVIGEDIELRINSELGNVEYAPRFIATPQPITVMEGATITFDCAAVGNPKPEIVWLINGVAIDLSDLDSRFYLVGSGSLGVQAARVSDSAHYTCRCTNTRDSAEHSAALLVRSAPRVHIPRARVLSARIRGDVSVRCESRSRPPPQLSWLKDGEPLTPNNHDLVLMDNGSSLRIQGVLSVDAGMWQCAARSNTGLALAAVRLIVHNDDPEEDKTEEIKPKTKPSKPNKKPKATSPTPKHVYAKTSLNSLKSESDTTSSMYTQPKISNSTQDIFNSLVSSETFVGDDTFDPSPEELDFLGETSSAYTPSPEYDYDNNPESDLIEPNFHAAKGLDISELTNRNATTVSMPKNFKAVIVKHRFVTLSWEAPDRIGEEIKGYAVIFKVKGSERERVSVGDAHKHEMNVASLQPNTTYTFVVYAYTEHGATPSEMIEISTPIEELLWSAPRWVRAESTAPHVATVTWAAPNVEHNANTPDKYTLSYIEMESGREQYVSVEADPTSEVISTTLSGLRAATEYMISVRAVGGGGATGGGGAGGGGGIAGGAAGVVALTTPSDVPAAPPGNVTAVTTGAKSILVQWLPPPPRSVRGSLTGYKVRYRARAGDRKQHYTITTPADTTRAELTQLDINTSYQIRVCAINANGSGPFSEWLSVTTQHAVPAAKPNVPEQPPPLTTRAGRDWISVWWAESAGARTYSGLVLGWGLGIPDEHSRQLPAHAHSALIQGLESNAEYVISLRASNALGLGPAVYATVRTKLAAADGDDPDDDDQYDDDDDEEPQPLIPPVGLKVIMLSGTTAVVYWTDPTLPKGQTATDGRRYVVRWSTSGSTGRARTYNATDLNCMIDELRPYTHYDFAVKLIKGGRESSWSMIVSNTSLEAAPASAPRDVRASPPSSGRGVDLTWSAPSKPNGVITGYIIMYALQPPTSGSDQQWTAVTVTGDRTRTRIERLRPRAEYVFKLQAKNSRGLGPFSTSVVYTTGLEGGEGSGLAQATSAWLWASAGGACAVLALAAALALSLCCRRTATPLHNNTSTYQKSSASAAIKPPDLWIHHDQMELKQMDKSIHSSASKISAGSMEGNLVSSTLTLGRAPPPPADYERPPPTMDRHYVPTYVESRRSPSVAGSSDETVRAGSSTHSCHCHTHYTMTGAGTCERRHLHRPPHPHSLADQYCDVGGGLVVLGSPQSSLASLAHPPPAPCGSGTCPLGSACSAPGAGGSVAGTLPPGGDIYACAARERGQYVAYEPLGQYTHRESVSSEAGGSVVGAPTLGGPVGLGASAGGSLQRRPCINNALLHSFTDNCSPTHTHGSVRETSPYKKSANSSPGHLPNRLHLGGSVPHCPSELEPLTPSRSTERLNREMQNLEGLMKDLSAITHHHC